MYTNKSNCSSKTFLAIAESNLKLPFRCIENNEPKDTTMKHLMVWRENLAYADAGEELEYNTRNNASWKRVSKNDLRKMWKLIDYKDKEAKLKENTAIDPKVIHHCFRNIFQASHLSRKATVNDVGE